MRSSPVCGLGFFVLKLSEDSTYALIREFELRENSWRVG